ncbi:hypothetical protein [Polaromonas sp.]
MLPFKRSELRFQQLNALNVAISALDYLLITVPCLNGPLLADFES